MSMVSNSIKEMIKRALEEDIRTGDITSEAIISAKQNATGEFLVKQDGVLAGFDIVEASGMVNLGTIKEIAETGVDYISVGSITHSVKALDISLGIKMR